MRDVNARPESLQDWALMFRQIYGEHNDKLYTTDSIFRQIMEKSSEVGEAVRRDAGVAPLLPVLFGWTMALWNRFDSEMEGGFDIAEAVWQKYPDICPYCFASNQCLCIIEEREYDPQDINMNAFRRDRKKMPKSLSEWQAMFQRHYGNINKIQSVSKTWLHVLEEIGEVSREERHHNFQEIKEESADVFAWLLGFCTRKNIDLDEITWRTYPCECNVCHQEKCACPYD